MADYLSQMLARMAAGQGMARAPQAATMPAGLLADGSQGSSPAQTGGGMFGTGPVTPDNGRGGVPFSALTQGHNGMGFLSALAAAQQPQGSSPILPQPSTPTTAPQTPPRTPPTPPVLPYQGNPFQYGMAGGEHAFFGGLNDQPYGLTAFTGYKPQQQPDAATLEEMVRRLLAQQQLQSQPWFTFGGGGDAGTGAGGQDNGGGAPGGGSGTGGSDGGW